MSLEQIIQAIFQYGGTVIMAVLFVWLFFWIINNLNKVLKENSETLKILAQSNENIAKVLDIISNKTDEIDKKADRNYLEIKEHKNQ